MTAIRPSGSGRTGRRRRAGVATVLLRELPQPSTMHRVWVGTKLISLAVLTVAVFLDPSWQQLAALAVLTFAAIGAARVPRSAAPRLPWWFWLTVLIGLGFAVAGHGAGHYLRLLALTTLFTVLSAVLVWTTALADLAPALSRLGAPLARLGLPIAEWAAVTALCVRSVAVLTDEMRVLMAARRLRPRSRSLRPGIALAATVDLLTAAMSVTLRRAHDMGEAIAARGGVSGPPPQPIRFSWRDVVVLGTVLVACVVPAAVS